MFSRLVKAPRQKVESQPQAETPEEAFYRIYGSEKASPGVPSGELPVKTEKKPENIATACIPCATGHYGTCSGLLNEAMRFAKKDGITSGEVIDRINMCMDELNAMERVDLRPELVADLPDWEKELADKALTNSRSLRHGLESLDNVADLERLAATTQTTRNDIGREWFRHRMSKPVEESKEEMPSELKKKLAAKGISESKFAEMEIEAAQRAIAAVEREVISE